jgi:hypothetical protein
VEDADVDSPILERLGLAQWIELEQREPDAREMRAKEAEHVWENPGVSRRLDEADAQSPRLALRGALRRSLRALRLRQRQASFGKEGSPRRRQLDAAWHALEQRRTDLALEDRGSDD